MKHWRTEPPPADAWEWLIDCMAAELAAMPVADAQDIIDRLDNRAGFHTVREIEEMFPVDTARRELVDRLMAKTWKAIRAGKSAPPASS